LGHRQQGVDVVEFKKNGVHMKNELPRDGEGNADQRHGSSENVEHACESGDQLTVLFCKATKLQDQAAMREFLTVALPLVTAAIARRCNKVGFSRGFAEAVACASLMKAINRAGTFDCERKIMNWLVGIAWRELADCIKADKDRECQRFEGQEWAIADIKDKLATNYRGCQAFTPQEKLMRREEEDRREQQVALLDQGIQKLAPIKRRVVELRRAGKPPRAIAEDLAIRPEQVSKIFFAAKEDLRRGIG
jgi:RNA polymerase sigma factor (sigma-70 family)